MTVDATRIAGMLIVRWPTFDDQRGFFRQTHQVRELEEALGRPVHLVQSNHARSRPGVVRGFHAEPWDKLTYVAHGTAMIAVADIRPDSATFGEVETLLIGDPPGERVRVFIAEGLAHAYATCGGEDIDYLYDVGAEWSPVDKRAIAWDDPDLAVTWPVDDPVISDEDRSNPTLRDRFGDHPRFSGR